MLQQHKRDPAEVLRFAIYEYDVNRQPWVVAEFDESVNQWSCRFCTLQFNTFESAKQMRVHILNAHLNG